MLLEWAGCSGSQARRAPRPLPAARAWPLTRRAGFLAGVGCCCCRRRRRRRRSSVSYAIHDAAPRPAVRPRSACVPQTSRAACSAYALSAADEWCSSTQQSVNLWSCLPRLHHRRRVGLARGAARLLRPRAGRGAAPLPGPGGGGAHAEEGQQRVRWAAEERQRLRWVPVSLCCEWSSGGCADPENKLPAVGWAPRGWLDAVGGWDAVAPRPPHSRAPRKGVAVCQLRLLGQGQRYAHARRCSMRAQYGRPGPSLTAILALQSMRAADQYVDPWVVVGEDQKPGELSRMLPASRLVLGWRAAGWAGGCILAQPTPARICTQPTAAYACFPTLPFRSGVGAGRGCGGHLQLPCRPDGGAVAGARRCPCPAAAAAAAAATNL